MTKPNFTFIDLFAGIGGFHHALAAPEFGGQCVLAVERDPDCRTVYRDTWPTMATSLQEDIRSLTRMADGRERPLRDIARLVPDHDVLCAGFPCQPFSKSGRQLGVLDETRGTLFFDIAKIIEAKRPGFLVLENVRNLVGPRHRATWNTIVDHLRALGYRVSSEPIVLSPHRIPPAHHGRPQSRERVFILGTRADDGQVLREAPLVAANPFPEWDTSSWRIEDYLLNDSEIPDLDQYKLRSVEVAWLNAWQAFVQGISSDDLPGFPIWVDAFTARPAIDANTPPWKAAILRRNSAFYIQHRAFLRDWMNRSWMDEHEYRVRDFPASRRKFEWQARQVQPRRRERDLWGLAMQFRPSGIRVRPATYLPALVAINQTSIIGSRRRRITPVEAARLQGLPDDVFMRSHVDDATAYRQAGNAVNVGVVQYVARQLFASSGLGWGQIHQAGSSV